MKRPVGIIGYIRIHRLTISEVTLEIGRPSGLDAVGVLLGAVGGLHEGDGGNELGPNHAGDGGEGGEASGDVLGAGEAHTGVGGEVTDDTEHGNAAVLLFVEVRRVW